MTDGPALAVGLCSITLRALPAEEVLAVAARAGVTTIEWGADVHVPPGDVDRARALARRGADLGIDVASYGSYLGAGPLLPDGGEVGAVLDAAEALGTSTVRVWTEVGVTPDAPEADRARVRDLTAALADVAADRGLGLALEHHPGTLTHTAAAGAALLAELDRPDVRTHWQPDPALSPAAAVEELRTVLPHLASVHAFTWGPTGIDDRRPLAEGAELWRPALALATTGPGPRPRPVLLEYVRGDDPDQVVADAATLRRWIDTLPAP
ncbi:TIM barrel protein [Iamia majanohamensis]|uniref:TIM barrel protein n=1 Tax=Iamia majanohamensis TaxID=467976 RepID=A0AAE9Y7U8_9ACTN|nr:TIM barrel protein [Iamia majanohamensis]WCO68157.1 TIM barrel protein [Iamia majanohamensis]